MRAIVVEHLHEPGALRDVPVPEPGPRDVLVRITVAGINPIDWKVRDVYGHALPFVLGQDFAGVVVGVGSGVRKYAVDQRVFGIAPEHGSYADYTMLPEDDDRQPLAHVPDGVGDADAAGLPTAGLTALACIERTNVGEGAIVAIVGVAGSVGRFAAQLAKLRGARVIGVGSVEQTDIQMKLGLEAYIAYEVEDAAKTLRERYPDGIDFVLDRRATRTRSRVTRTCCAKAGRSPRRSRRSMRSISKRAASSASTSTYKSRPSSRTTACAVWSRWSSRATLGTHRRRTRSGERPRSPRHGQIRQGQRQSVAHGGTRNALTRCATAALSN